MKEKKDAFQNNEEPADSSFFWFKIEYISSRDPEIEWKNK